ncbi:MULTISPECIES: tetratricopeptide repeat protein [Dictyoglomus]|jgi:tetratricopeptide (TPR) repeat protein|uniref:TPR repeat-containing protein n=1 Tax=Dictyoglomus turgidum (strain DSM 6724 / Z-1310) TaxID=515635 RepID=B8DYX5_DICTD|nr:MULTISPECIES: tetratricopeptide repeat protein [Dictyoglomus]ACK41601.1 TPR repeat-containing protein [Dictyoglomus turgidum DSM 6724]PNV79076.1 MAG: tetratricopeptide repeat protein [Dictyoglomus turgidum]HBU31680.1 tetratricopeptide repeat protein [Dictyoglomus sp.]
MKNLFLILFLSVFVISNLFAIDFDTANKIFFEARRDRDVEKIKALISTLEGDKDLLTSSQLLTVLADSYLEYGLWGVEGKEKEKIYEKARSYAEKAIKLDPNNGRAWYIAGASIGRLAQYRGIVQSLFMLKDFDRYISKAIEILNDPLYRTFALLAMGMRYRDVPWPLYNYEKAESYMKEALKYTPIYPNIYLELGYLYLKMGKKDLAKEMFIRVVKSDPHPWLIKTHEESVNLAKKELEKLGGI